MTRKSHASAFGSRLLVAAVVSLLVFPLSSAEAGTVKSGLVLTVAGNNAVTISNQGSNTYPGGVGTLGNYSYTNGWGWVSGSVEWRDNNNTLTLRLDSSGIDVLNNNGVANSNGSISNTSVSLSGNSTLGSGLRSTYGVGTSSFTSTISAGSVDFNVTGTVTVDPVPPLILLTGLDVDVAANNAVTVNNAGSGNNFGNVGSSGTYGYANGWSHASGTRTWPDTNGNTAATLGSSGVNIPVTNRVANQGSTGSVQLAASTVLGGSLRTTYGVGTSSFTSIIAIGSKEYGVSGTVTVAPLSPDLVVQSPAVNDATLMEGQSFTASATVRNSGLGTAVGTTLRYLRSTNSLICYTCGVDVEIGTDAVGKLGPGATSLESQKVLAPLVNTGIPYWIGACVDSVDGESLTSNQCSAGVPIEMTCDAVTARSQTVGTAKSFSACGDLTVGPSLTVTTDLGANFSGGESVAFVNGFEVGVNGVATASVCGQDLCDIGPGSTPLDATCNPCVQSVCAVDSFCCSTDWDAICVGRIDDTCGLYCP